jgi:hypothetical protein
MKAMKDDHEYAAIAMEESAAKIKDLEDQLRESNYKVHSEVCI